MENMDHPFLDEIFTNEAKGILSDLAMQPSLLSQFMFIEEDMGERAIDYIKSIFCECYMCKGLFIPTLYSDDGELCAYALLFIHPDPKYPKYLHKIYVKEKY